MSKERIICDLGRTGNRLAMAVRGRPLFALLLFLLGSLTVCEAVVPSVHVSSFNRSSFPAGFIFGTASSAYQYEGAAGEGGKGPSIWDTFTHQYPGKIADGSNGDVAIDSYHRYKEDVRIMKGLNLDAYRFSISWARVLPNGKLSGGVNKEGIRYYNNLINELLASGIKPFVTLFHWDLPQLLEDKYGGFYSPYIVDDFRDYAELCFQEFGDRVKYWITMNEPWSYSTGGYTVGVCSRRRKTSCNSGDLGREPYLVAHNQLLAHAAAAKLYKKKFQEKQKGVIGIALNSNYFVPLSNTRQNHDASQRALDFMLGWFMDPLTKGDYPRIMCSLVKDRLPKFSEHQSQMLNQSFDFIGLNHYTSSFAANALDLTTGKASYFTDAHVRLLSERNGKLIGPKSASGWLYVYPRGIQDLLLYIKRKYNNPLIYITENGISEANNATLSLREALADHMRIHYFYSYLSFIRRAIKNGVNLKGYFAWSLLDNFEWGAGYTVRFGINYVDYKDGLRRHAKLSARWFRTFLRQEN